MSKMITIIGAVVIIAIVVVAAWFLVFNKDGTLTLDTLDDEDDCAKYFAWPWRKPDVPGKGIREGSNRTPSSACNGTAWHTGDGPDVPGVRTPYSLPPAGDRSRCTRPSAGKAGSSRRNGKPCPVPRRCFLHGPRPAPRRRPYARSRFRGKAPRPCSSPWSPKKNG